MHVVLRISQRSKLISNELVAERPTGLYIYFVVTPETQKRKYLHAHEILYIPGAEFNLGKISLVVNHLQSFSSTICQKDVTKNSNRNVVVPRD
jgi:hypothetical protein